MPGRIPPELVDRIRESTDIVDLISEYVKLEKKGTNHFGLCPFHPEKTPSFSVHQGKQIFHCFGCGQGGNVFTFLQEHDKLSFMEAARELAQRAGIEIPDQEKSAEVTDRYDALYQANEFAVNYFSRCLWEGKGEEFEAVRGYLTSRHIPADVAKSFHLGYAPDRWDGLVAGIKKFSKDAPEIRDFIEAGLLQKKESRVFDRFRGRLMFPIHNLSGKTVGFGGRTLNKDEKAKYINTQQTQIYNKSFQLYGLYFAREQLRRRGECLIVEGYTDLMRLHENGFIHSVASSGTALTVDQARILRRFCQKVVLVFDGDTAGSHASLRGGDVLLATDLDVKVVALPEGHDPDSFVRENGASALGDLIDNAMHLIDFRIDLYRRENRLIDVPSRTAVAKELISSLAVIPDPIKRELTAQEAARQIGVASETILRELNRARTPALRKSDLEKINADPFAAYPVKERGLMESIIRWPELREPVFSEINSQDFQHKVIKRIAEQLEGAWLNGEEPRDEQIINESTEPEDARFIAYALSQTVSLTNPDIDPKAKRRYDDFLSAQDCLRDLLVARINREEEKARSELVKKPPMEQVSALLSRIKELAGQRKTVKCKMFWENPPHPSIDFSQEELLEKALRKGKK